MHAKFHSHKVDGSMSVSCCYRDTRKYRL